MCSFNVHLLCIARICKDVMANKLLLLLIFTYNQGKIFLILPVTRWAHVYLVSTGSCPLPPPNSTTLMPMVRFELATLGYKLSVLGIELTSSKAIAGKELSLSSWCIALLYIYLLVRGVPVSSRTTVLLR